MNPRARSRPSITQAPFGRTPAGQAVDLFTVTNPQGVGLRVITFGGIIQSLWVPDRQGRLADVVLGHDSLDEYVNDNSYFGAIVGRVANRITRAQFTLDGKLYRLAANVGVNHLHGGRVGFDRVVWRAAPFSTDGDAGLTLSYHSPDGEEGYPGNLDVRVQYTLTSRNELVVDFNATTDRATPVNLTQHAYFNLNGDGVGDILDHSLQIEADWITPMNAELLPTGELVPVKGGPFDFVVPTTIGTRIGADHPQLHYGKGYDHNFVLRRDGTSLVRAAQLVEPVSGRTLDVFTTEPGLQFYSGNVIDGRVPGKGRRVYGPRSGLCLETQHFPDSPNQPAFPSTILRPGERLQSRTVFVFGVSREAS